MKEPEVSSRSVSLLLLQQQTAIKTTTADKSKNFVNRQKFDQMVSIALHDNQFTFWIDSLNSITTTENSAVGLCRKLHMWVCFQASAVSSLKPAVQVATHSHSFYHRMNCARFVWLSSLPLLFLCFCHCKISVAVVKVTIRIFRRGHGKHTCNGYTISTRVIIEFFFLFQSRKNVPIFIWSGYAISNLTNVTDQIFVNFRVWADCGNAEFQMVFGFICFSVGLYACSILHAQPTLDVVA